MRSVSRTEAIQYEDDTGNVVVGRNHKAKETLDGVLTQDPQARKTLRDGVEALVMR